MLRLYKPIASNPIFELHILVEHLVCNVWCEADNNAYTSKLHLKLAPIVQAYPWLQKGVSVIYEECKKLKRNEKESIKNAFEINNRIEDLCDGNIEPIPLSALPDIVTTKMKPLFVKFYEDLLNKAKVCGDKLEYYKTLYGANKFRYCPCCGYMAFESGQNDIREAYDHYLPKSKYPFASVNFKNLVPLCYKCNSDHKKSKDPISGKKRAYYPYRTKEIDTNISMSISKGFVTSMYESFVNNLDDQNASPPRITDFQITLNSATEPQQVLSWDRLFAIKKRFADRTGQFSFSLIKEMRLRHRANKIDNPNRTFESTIDSNIEIFKSLCFEDEYYLKTPFLQALKSYQVIMNIYN